MRGLTPICPYCNAFSVPATGEEIYPHRPDLKDKKFFRCIPCESWVGVHAMTGAPLGTLANAKLRKIRSQVHEVFDPLWKEPANRDWLISLRGKAKKKPGLGSFIVKHRTEAYVMLGQAMDIEPDLCHIAMFNEEQCRKAIDLINSREIFRSR